LLLRKIESDIDLEQYTSLWQQTLTKTSWYIILDVNRIFFTTSWYIILDVNRIFFTTRLFRWDADNDRIENWSVTEYRLYSGSWNYKFGLIFYLYSWETHEGHLPHMWVETYRRTAKHNLYPLEYQSSV